MFPFSILIVFFSLCFLNVSNDRLLSVSVLKIQIRSISDRFSNRSSSVRVALFRLTRNLFSKKHVKQMLVLKIDFATDLNGREFFCLSLTEMIKTIMNCSPNQISLSIKCLWTNRYNRIVLEISWNVFFRHYLLIFTLLLWNKRKKTCIQLIQTFITIQM